MKASRRAKLLIWVAVLTLAVAVFWSVGGWAPLLILVGLIALAALPFGVGAAMGYLSRSRELPDYVIWFVALAFVVVFALMVRGSFEPDASGAFSAVLMTFVVAKYVDLGTDWARKPDAIEA